MKMSFFKSFKLYIAALLLPFCVFAMPVIAVNTVSAHHCFGHAGTGGEGASGNIAECADAGACLDTEGATCPAQETAGVTVNKMVKTVISLLSFVIGVVAVIMIIVGGLKYITSGGDAGKVTSAKNTILYAVIGLVIVALAQVIVRFVLQKSDPSNAAPTTSIVRGRV
jgi:hypothetical protein